MTVIPGEGRVPILYGNQPMARPPHRDGYVARPDAVAPHPGVVIVTAHGPTPASKTLARHLARHGYAVVVPPGTAHEVTAAVDALGSAWAEWSRRDRRAVVGIGDGATLATEAAGTHGLPLILLSPEGGAEPLVGPALLLGPAGATPVAGRRIAYHGVGPGFWDDAAPDYAPAAARDALGRIVGFLDRHLGVAAAA